MPPPRRPTAATASCAPATCVYVSVNYRLGALGYLDFSSFSTPERTFDTNLGLRDQLAALRWVQDNIAAFGGDPDNVTIFGESAGAISVTTLMTVPAARGLFHRAIAESSAPGIAWSTERAGGWARQYVRALADVNGIPVPGTAREPLPAATATRLLDAASTEDLLAASDRMRNAADDTPGVLLTAPTVDGDLLPEAPLDAFEAGRSHPVPLIIGTNDTEGRLFELPGLKLDLLVSDERADALFAATQPELGPQVLAAYRGHGATARTSAATTCSGTRRCRSWRRTARRATRSTPTGTTSRRGCCACSGCAPRTPPSSTRCSGSSTPAPGGS